MIDTSEISHGPIFRSRQVGKNDSVRVIQMEEQNNYLSKKVFRQLLALLIAILILEIILVAIKFWPWVEKLAKRDLINQR